jgi:hypothetical protein
MKTARCTPKYTIVEIITHLASTLDIGFLQARESLIALYSCARIRIAVEGARLTLPVGDYEKVLVVMHDLEVNVLALLVPPAVLFEILHGSVCAGVDLLPLRHTRRETNLCVVVLNGWHNTPRSVA